jgi:hypothetical protein
VGEDRRGGRCGHGRDGSHTMERQAAGGAADGGGVVAEATAHAGWLERSSAGQTKGGTKGATGVAAMGRRHGRKEGKAGEQAPVPGDVVASHSLTEADAEPGRAAAGQEARSRK